MKWISFVTLISAWVPLTLFAIEPVTLSAPTPSIATSYGTNSVNTVIYTVTNNVPSALPVKVSGISNGVSRTTVTNDCGNTMPAGPSTCNIGITINPSNAQAGTSIVQTLIV